MDTSPDSITRYFSSWLLSPLWLALARALISLYAFITIFVVLGLESRTSARQSFSYFTVLGYWGLAFYTLVSAIHTFVYWRRGVPLLQSWPRVLVYAHGAFYATVTVFPIVVTIVFWAVLSSGAFDSEFSTWANISQHALNSVIAVFEIVVPRTEPLAWIMLVPLIVILACYLALAYMSHATEGFYVYSFLDPRHGRGLVAGACIAILAAAVIVFVAVHYLIRLRGWTTETKLGKHGKLSPRDQRVSGFENRATDLSVQMVNVDAK